MRIKIMAVAAVLVLIFFISGCGKSTGLEGKVVDGRGQPIANVKVVAKMSQPIKGYEQVETTTGSEGSFKFVKLFPASEYQLILYSDRWITERKIITQSGPEGQTKILPDPVTIRFMDSNGGIVLDTQKNLMWAAKDNGSSIDWQGAKRYCEGYRGGGYTDWRMPTQKELSGLYDSAVTGKNGYHLTNAIELTGREPWAIEFSGSGFSSYGSTFNFENGHPDSAISCGIGGSALRALPVRSAK